MRLILIICISLSNLLLIAQDNATPRSSKLLSKFGIGYDIPGGDMADRFGNNMNFHLGLDYILASDWYVSGGFTYRFGDKVKEDVLAGFRHDSGDFLAPDGQLGLVLLRERGASLQLTFGKFINILSPNADSGFRIGAGINYSSHYIRIQDENRAINQVLEPYKKGYDRLSRGFGLTQEIGYMYMSPTGLLNLYLGAEFNQMFTKPVRSIDLASNTQLTQDRKDLISGLKFSMFIPIFRGSNSNEVIYY